MMNNFFNARVLIALLCITSIAGGCLSSRKEQQMKKITIKMISPENIHGVMLPDNDHIWIVGDHGFISHSSDGGKTWNSQKSGVETLLVDGVFLDNTAGWVAGLYGTILHTTDGGKTWTKQNTGTDKHLFSVSFVDAQNGWAIGEWHTIIHTADGGKTWEKQAEEQDKIFNNVLFTDTENGWIVGEAGTILKTADGGKTWNTVMPSFFERATLEEEYERPRPALFGIAATDKNNIWICGIDGTMLRTSDAGATWEICPVNSANAIYSVVMKNGTGWAVGDKGVYLTTPDGGKTWKFLDDTIKTKTWIRDLYFSSPENGWVVGAGGVVVHTTDGGKRWEFESGLSYAMEFFQMPKALEFKNMVFE